MGKCERCGKPVKRKGQRWCSVACYTARRFYAGLMDHEYRLEKMAKRYAKDGWDYAYRATLRFYRAYHKLPCEDDTLFDEWIRMVDDEKGERSCK